MTIGHEMIVLTAPAEYEYDNEQSVSSSDPTKDTYEELNRAYEFFNERLFDGKLPACMITLRARGKSLGYYHGQRFLHPDGRTTAEIALNPEAAAYMSPIQCLSTLVHEQVHLKQDHLGLAPRRAYHDKWFAAEMLRVGLITSDTGAPGGKSTGQSMSDYIELGGLFESTAKEFIANGFSAIWYDRVITMLSIPQEPSVAMPEDKYTENEKPPRQRMSNQEMLDEMVKMEWKEGERPSLLDNLGKMEIRQPVKKDPSKTKFRCMKCGCQAWAKDSIKLKCGACDLKMYRPDDAFDDIKPENEDASKSDVQDLRSDIRQLPLLPPNNNDWFEQLPTNVDEGQE